MPVSPKVFKQVRKALGLTQEELAQQLGLSRVTINKMERGRLRRGIPDEIAARLLALKERPGVRHELNATRALNAMKTLNDQHLWDNEEDDQ